MAQPREAPALMLTTRIIAAGINAGTSRLVDIAEHANATTSEAIPAMRRLVAAGLFDVTVGPRGVRSYTATPAGHAWSEPTVADCPPIRSERVVVASTLRNLGVCNADIAAALGISMKYVSELLHDETGDRKRSQRAGRHSACCICGGPSLGRGDSYASGEPVVCRSCHESHRTAAYPTRQAGPAPHGAEHTCETCDARLSMYRGLDESGQWETLCAPCDRKLAAAVDALIAHVHANSGATA